MHMQSDRRIKKFFDAFLFEHSFKLGLKIKMSRVSTIETQLIYYANSKHWKNL